MIEGCVQNVIAGVDLAPSLSALVAESRKDAARKAIDAFFTDRAPLYAALAAEEPKVRKNAARLLGALQSPADAKLLADALKREETLFVAPSLLLALGSCGGPDAREAVSAYAVPKPSGVSEEKHCAEINEAYRKARALLFPKHIETVTTLAAPREILLVSPDGFGSILADELIDLGFAPKPDPRGARIVTGDLSQLFLARCFTEALFPVCEGALPEPESLAKAFSNELTLPYRVELRNYAGDRADWISRFTAAAGGENNPSHYALEARIELHNGKADAYIRRTNVPDARFAYRKQALPASMHPALAASIVRYAAPYRKSENASVLDPCCGSGTFLIERELDAPCKSLFGVDLAPNAVLAARINAAAAKSAARFIQKDLTKFTPRAPVDEIYANLPFGNRVGTHENNERLYRALCSALPSWLVPGGIAVLYTMEYRLLDACLKREKLLVRKNAVRTEAGGLLPWVFVVERA